VTDLVNAQDSTYAPVVQNGGIATVSTADAVTRLSGWLALFPGQYVALAYGHNDALASSVNAKSFHDSMASMIQTLGGAGNTPVLPPVPWGRSANLAKNVPVLNAQIAQLLTEYPAAVAGPDLYSYYQSNQSLIGGDGGTPSWDAGYAGLRQVWADSVTD